MEIVCPRLYPPLSRYLSDSFRGGIEKSDEVQIITYMYRFSSRWLVWDARQSSLQSHRFFAPILTLLETYKLINLWNKTVVVFQQDLWVLSTTSSTYGHKKVKA
jgi:hypothetical protein